MTLTEILARLPDSYPSMDDAHYWRAQLAAAWAKGHRNCTCKRPGATPCPNPYR